MGNALPRSVVGRSDAVVGRKAGQPAAIAERVGLAEQRIRRAAAAAILVPIPAHAPAIASPRAGVSAATSLRPATFPRRRGRLIHVRYSPRASLRVRKEERFPPFPGHTLLPEC